MFILFRGSTKGKRPHTANSDGMMRKHASSSFCLLSLMLATESGPSKLIVTAGDAPPPPYQHQSVHHNKKKAGIDNWGTWSERLRATLRSERRTDNCRPDPSPNTSFRGESIKVWLVPCPFIVSSPGQMTTTTTTVQISYTRQERKWLVLCVPLERAASQHGPGCT